MISLQKFLLAILILASIFLPALQTCSAQDLTPRLQSPAPARLHTLAFGYAYSHGNYLLDSSLPLQDVKARVNTLVLGYSTTFQLFGRAAKFDVAVPLGAGTWEGLVNGVPASATRTGFGDPVLALSVNILGNRPLLLRQFMQYRERFLLGVSLGISVPLGQYDKTKLVNLGTHRWVFKPTFGGSFKTGKWIFEAFLNAWFFTTNSAYFNGNTLAQNPLYAVQFHVIHTFRPGLWAALSAGRNYGGETIVNGIHKRDIQQNSRFGATLAIPLTARSGLRLGWTNGISVRFGADFTTWAIGYWHSWAKSGPK